MRGWPSAFATGRQRVREGAKRAMPCVESAIPWMRWGSPTQPFRGRPREPLTEEGARDEVQDPSLVGVRLLHALAGGDVADGLTVVGDGQQSVFPGGFRLSEAGVDVRGRSTVLRTNYRNTDEILSFATRLVVGLPFADLDEEGSRDEISSERHGRRPSRLMFPTEQVHDEVLVDHVRTLLLHDHVWHGDIAVIAPTNKAVQHYVATLRAAGIPALNLVDHDGTPREQVRVTTYQRAKGLEFKHVLLPRLDPVGLGINARRPTGKTGEVYDEQIELLRRQLFVAMTRARDSLWVGFVGTNALDMLVS
jgi:superfamily I DNA/RNA helicase